MKEDYIGTNREEGIRYSELYELSRDQASHIMVLWERIIKH